MKLRLITIAIAMILVSSVLLNTRASNSQSDERSLRTQKTNQKEQRVALVIGNSAYKDAPLLNPVNDAEDMAQTLREFGFEVLYGENLTQNEMKRSIRAFGDRIRSGGVGLFYYAGHGIQSRGSNYLIPVGASITKEDEVEYESVDVGFILAQMEDARNRLNIVILDACRNNPFARSFRSAKSGLASIDAPSGTLIAYATAPGSVASDGTAKNGLYTQELLKHIRTPSLNIEQVFKQVRIVVSGKSQGKQIPWESSSLIGDFYFLNTDEPAKVTTPQTNIQSLDPAAIELSFWETIKNSSNPEDFQAYLREYPNGRFASLARIRAKSQSSIDKTPGSNSVVSDSISGIYQGVAKSDSMGDIPVTLELRNDGGKLSGKVDTPQGPSRITSGTYTNGRLILKLDAGGNELTFNAQVNAGRMVGEWELTGQKGTLDLKKVSR